ncbi:MAG: HPP family protein [Porticoccaceae bacterium]
MAVKNLYTEFKLLLGIEKKATTHTEKLISALGAFIAIAGIYQVTNGLFEQGYLNQTGQNLVIASMGASAVLLFAVPHGLLSQPWAVFGGHLISALIGVFCQRYIPHTIYAAALAVSLSVLFMYYLHCIHPPGGATALTAVIGGSNIFDLGYGYVIAPILVNVVLILVVAVAFNCLFRWRRYPVHLLHRRKTVAGKQLQRQYELTHEDFAAAMQEFDSYMDITAEDLAQLLELAKLHAEKNITHPEKIIEGRFYSNGKIGNLWSIRQIIDASNHGDPHKEQVIYKVIAGDGSYETGICSREEFRLWTRFEVTRQNAQWIKVDDP